MLVNPISDNLSVPESRMCPAGLHVISNACRPKVRNDIVVQVIDFAGLKATGWPRLDGENMNQIGILKSLWKKNETGAWVTHDIKGIHLKPREGFESDYFRAHPRSLDS